MVRPPFFSFSFLYNLLISSNLINPLYDKVYREQSPPEVSLNMDIISSKLTDEYAELLQHHGIEPNDIIDEINSLRTKRDEKNKVTSDMSQQLTILQSIFISLNQCAEREGNEDLCNFLRKYTVFNLHMEGRMGKLRRDSLNDIEIKELMMHAKGRASLETEEKGQYMNKVRSLYDAPVVHFSLY